MRSWRAVAAIGLVGAAAAMSGCGGQTVEAASTAPAPVATPAATPTAVASASAPATPLPPPVPAVLAAARTALTVYRSPTAAKPYERLGRQTVFGSHRVLLVTAQQPGWVQALLPQRPNGSRGWIPATQVQLSTTPYHVQISLRTHRAIVTRDGTVVFTTKVATGKASTPTAHGLFFITDVIKVLGYQPWYGPYALALSGYSPVLQTFEGGDAELAIHGTNEPGLLGTSASHGCIRMGNAAVTRLAHLVPPGTPVTIS